MEESVSERQGLPGIARDRQGSPGVFGLADDGKRPSAVDVSLKFCIIYLYITKVGGSGGGERKRLPAIASDCQAFLVWRMTGSAPRRWTFH